MEWPGLRVWGRDLALAAFVGAFIGVIGPFGSFLNGPLGPRIAYWTASVVLGTVIYGVTLRLARTVARRMKWPGWVAFLLGATVGSGPVAVVSWVIAVRMWPFLAQTLNARDWWLQCLVMGLPLAGGYALLHLYFEGRGAMANEADDTGPPDRFPREVICLQMEDHYVRAHTSQGSKLHLMTLSDAMARVARPGLQVHRSWWVARDAVAQVTRDGRALRLKLLNGLEVPVARRAVARLKAEGLDAD